MTFSTPIHTNEQSFERVLATGLPTLLVFTRKNCAPCAELDKQLARLAVVFEGRALIAKINTDENPSLTQKYAVKATPGLVFARGGEQVAATAGALDFEQLRAALGALAEGGPLANLPAGPSTPLASAPSGEAADAAQAGAGLPLKLTDATFEQAVRGPLPVLVDFWAAWCGPCRMVAPSIDALAREFAGRAVVAKLNVDENQRTAQRYNVMSIPTLMIFRRGQVVDTVMGAQPLPNLRAALQRHVA